MLEVRMLGQFEVRKKGEPVLIPSRPAQSLVAYLIFTAGIAHRREKLAGMIWPESSEENARSNLRQALWRARKALDSNELTDNPKGVSSERQGAPQGSILPVLSPLANLVHLQFADCARM